MSIIPDSIKMSGFFPHPPLHTLNTLMSLPSYVLPITSVAVWPLLLAAKKIQHCFIINCKCTNTL